MSEQEVKKYSLVEVQEKANAKEPWIVISDSVYDVKEFLNDVRLPATAVISIVSFRRRCVSAV